MSEAEKEVLKTFKSGLGLTGAEQEILANYIDKLQKVIDLIIDDFQAENYFIGMTNKEVREYYKKRKELKE